MGTLHCMLENGVDLYLNERQKIRHYLARSTEEKEEEERRRRINRNFLTSSGSYVNCAVIAMLYTHSIVNQP